MLKNKAVYFFLVIFTMTNVFFVKKLVASEFQHSGYGFEFIGSLGNNDKRILTGSAAGEQEFYSWLSLKYTGGYGILSTNLKADRNISYFYFNPSIRFYPFKKYFYIDFGADFLYALDHYNDAEIWQFTVAPTYMLGFLIPSPLDDLFFDLFYKGTYVFDHNVISYWYNKNNPNKGVLIHQLGAGFKFAI